MVMLVLTKIIIYIKRDRRGFLNTIILHQPCANLWSKTPKGVDPDFNPECHFGTEIAESMWNYSWQTILCTEGSMEWSFLIGICLMTRKMLNRGSKISFTRDEQMCVQRLMVSRREDEPRDMSWHHARQAIWRELFSLPSTLKIVHKPTIQPEAESQQWCLMEEWSVDGWDE